MQGQFDSVIQDKAKKRCNFFSLECPLSVALSLNICKTKRLAKREMFGDQTTIYCRYRQKNVRYSQ